MRHEPCWAGGMRTHNSLVLLVSLTACATLGLAVTSRARACSARPCFAGSVWPPGGSVPVNQMQLYYEPPSDYASPGDAGVALPRLYRVTGSMRQLVPVELAGAYRPYVVVPQVPFEPGAEYALEAEPPTCDAGAPLAARFVVTPARPLPTQLGALRAASKRGPLQVAASGSCTATVDAAYADLTVELDQAAEPYADVLRYTLIVDDMPRNPFQTAVHRWTRPPQGTDRVYAACALPYPGAVLSGQLSPGAHRVRMRATLPTDSDGGAALETPELQIELRCDAADGGSANDGGRGQDVATKLDSGMPADGAAHALPPGTRLDAGPASDRDDASTTETPPRDDMTNAEAGSNDASADGGCSASSSRAGGVPTFLFACLAIGLHRTGTRKKSRARARTTKTAATPLR